MPRSVRGSGIKSSRMSEHSNSNGAGPMAPSFGDPFAGDKKDRRSAAPLLIAGAVVLLILVALVLFTRGHGQKPIDQALPLDPYAASLPLTNLKPSESTSLSGGKSTYIDGHVANNGSRTVTGVTVQVFFRNDVGLAPQIETLPLALIRSREPYVDTEPVAAAPLQPGAGADFRLIFENIGSNWNMQTPEIHVTQVTSK